MDTKIVPLSEIEEAAELLKWGEPVVFPTETVYGLGAPLFDERAIGKIFTIKGRPPDNPLIAHVASREEAVEIVSEVPEIFWTLADRFWPGPLTLVLKRHPRVPPAVSAGHPTLAIRMPDHSAALELIRRVGQPLAAPSANLSGRPSPTRAVDAWEDLQGKVALILDGGDCPIGIESTVISLIGSEPLLLRPGTIEAGEVEELIKKKVVSPSDGGAIHAPGMKYRHYAPRARVVLVMKREELCGPFVLSLKPRPGERLLSPKTLYSQFREADRLGAETIEIDCSPELLANCAMMNRLSKAAAADT